MILSHLSMRKEIVQLCDISAHFVNVERTSLRIVYAMTMYTNLTILG